MKQERAVGEHAYGVDEPRDEERVPGDGAGEAGGSEPQNKGEA